MQYKIKKPWLHIQIDETFHDHSIDDVLRHYRQSKKNRYLLYLEKRILHNRKQPVKNAVLKRGDTLSLQIFEDQKESLPSDATCIDIAYEDDIFLVINKPPHILIHSDGSDEMTLCNRVQAYFNKTQQACVIRPIHRLDKDTSGLVIFCKCAFFQPYLDEQLQQKAISREYKAIVEGILPLHKDIQINQPIGRDRHHSSRQRVSKTGKASSTSIRCEKHIQGNSLINCTLKTGRRHQIRVHTAFLNHPILSDKLYGHPSPFIERIALHAYKVTFPHPLTMNDITVTANLPKDFPIADRSDMKQY